LPEELGKAEKVCDAGVGGKKVKVSFKVLNSFSGFPEKICPKVRSDERRGSG